MSKISTILPGILFTFMVSVNGTTALAADTPEPKDPCKVNKSLDLSLPVAAENEFKKKEIHQKETYTSAVCQAFMQDKDHMISSGMSSDDAGKAAYEIHKADIKKTLDPNKTNRFSKKISHYFSYLNPLPKHEKTGRVLAESLPGKHHKECLVNKSYKIEYPTIQADGKITSVALGNTVEYYDPVCDSTMSQIELSKANGVSDAAEKAFKAHKKDLQTRQEHHQNRMIGKITDNMGFITPDRAI